MRAIGLLTLLALSCAHGPPTVGGLVKCGTEAIQKCAPLASPAVNECLAGSGDIVACLTELIQPTGCMVENVIACVVRKEGQNASAAYQANSGDTIDAWRAKQAKEYIAKRSIHFAD